MTPMTANEQEIGSSVFGMDVDRERTLKKLFSQEEAAAHGSQEACAHSKSAPEDRRAAPRFGVDEDAYLLLLKNNSSFSCRLVNLSLRGCCLRTLERLPAGSMVHVEVTFKVRGFLFRLSGMTRWTDGRHLVGIRFVDMPTQRKEELVEALDKIKAATPAAAAQTPAPARAKPMERERRGNRREAVDTSAVIFLINVASRLTGRILDLSMSGCRIRTDEHFPVGIYTRVETEFRLKGLPFRLGGVIQAIHDRNTVGIRFLDMSSRKREQVEQLIAEIEEMRAGD
jgi:c-di-GMP-binding flagellar brake protein YcgR